MMMMIPGIFTYGTNTYRYSFRRYFGCMPSSSLPTSWPSSWPSSLPTSWPSSWPSSSPEDHVWEVLPSAHRGEERSELLGCNSALYHQIWEKLSHLKNCTVSIFLLLEKWPTWNLELNQLRHLIISFSCVFSFSFIVLWFLEKEGLTTTSTPPLLTMYIQSSMSSPAFSSCRLLTCTLIMVVIVIIIIFILNIITIRRRNCCLRKVTCPRWSPRIPFEVASPLNCVNTPAKINSPLGKLSFTF